MYICYIDESGTPQIPGNTSHYILAGLAIPIVEWKNCDSLISKIKNKYKLKDAEIHTAWILRPYFEQNKIASFDTLDHSRRRYEVNKLRNSKLLLKQKGKGRKAREDYSRLKKYYKKTEAYIHLTHDERKRLIKDIAKCVSKWGFARLFAECIDKIFFDPAKSSQVTDEQAFEQVVSRFEQYLGSISNRKISFNGLLVHDNNHTVSKQHTLLMKSFYNKGTLWTSINRIIETPLFVDSQLTSMVQIADLCSYSIRRYLENNEDELFDLIFSRADRRGTKTVGVRHFSEKSCKCKICTFH